jgi:NAD(P)-dependent dehydrogenase (short-subunit alcohol dehydrogenase family)
VFRAALSSFTKLYADQHAAKNIRMNSLLAGWVDTYPVQAADLAHIPMGRPAQPQEIANVVAFLLSEEASYLTAQNLSVDGGLLRGL